MKNKKLTIYIILGVVIIFAIGGYFYWQKQNEEFKLITNDEELSEFMMNMREGDLEKYLAKKDELYAQDTYGGNTPEETLQMYIDALKAGDLELASKYFRLEDREVELESLEKMSADRIQEYTKFIDVDKKVFCNDNNTDCDIEILIDKEYVVISQSFINPQTNKWKLKSI